MFMARRENDFDLLMEAFQVEQALPSNLLTHSDSQLDTLATSSSASTIGDDRQESGMSLFSLVYLLFRCSCLQSGRLRPCRPFLLFLQRVSPLSHFDVAWSFLSKMNQYNPLEITTPSTSLQLKTRLIDAQDEPAITFPGKQRFRAHDFVGPGDHGRRVQLVCRCCCSGRGRIRLRILFQRSGWFVHKIE